MRSLTAGTIAICIATLALGIVITTPERAAATVTCTKGVSRLATPADLENMRLAGIPNPTVGMEYCPDDANAGKDAGQAKIYLRSIVCAGSAFGGTTADGTIEGLDSKFAECAAKFLKAMSSQVGGTVPLYSGGTNAVCVREGYRTPQQQEKYAQEYRNGGGIACTKGAACEHPRGIAIDVNTASMQGYQTMWAQGPSFGVNFYLKERDKVHFVPMQNGCTGGGQSFSGTGTSAPTGGTNAPNAPLPKSFYDYPQYAPASAASAATPFLSPLTSLATQTAQPTQQQTQPTPTYPNYQNLFPNDQLYATTTYYVPPAYGTSTVTYPQSTTSYADMISSMNTDTRAGSAQTSTSAPTRLNDNLSDIVVDSKTGGSNVSEDIAMNDQLAPHSLDVDPIHVPNTFDENGTQVQVQNQPANAATNANDSILRTMLVALRDLLQTYLSFLTSHKTTAGFKAPWQPSLPEQERQIAD